MRSWLTAKESCDVCGERVNRGESDYFLGAMMFNLGFSELLFVVFFVGVILIMWPNPSWGILLWSGVGVMIAAPFICYPFSKGLWLAIDLHFRPELDEGVEPSATRIPS